MTATARKPMKVERLAQELEAQPLVGVTKAAELLGIKPPNFRRDAAPHLTAVEVEGSASVYFRSEVERLGAERERAKSARTNGDG